MRVLLWNCNNGLGKKEQIDQFRSFTCDIAVVPELKESNIETLKPDDSVWITNNFGIKKPKGLGVLAFNGWKLEELPRDEDMEIYIPLKLSKDEFSFNLLALWNFYSACKSGRFKGVKGDKALEWEAMRHYDNLLSDPSLVVGDFNFGPTFSSESFLHLVQLLEKKGLKSLYHHFFDLEPSETEHPTFKTTRDNFHHLDHMFGSKRFFSTIKKFEIIDFKKVVLSDHSPLLLEVE